MRTYFTFKMEKKQRPIAKSRQTAYSYSRRVMIMLDSRHKGLVHTYPDIFENGDFFLRF